MNSGNFIARWDLSLASECRIAFPIDAISGSSVAIRAVFAEDLASVKDGSAATLCGPVSASAAGFFKSEWSTIPPEALGEVYVGFMLEAATAIETLVVGVAQLHIRG